MPRWYFEKRELRHTPSVSKGLSHEQELHYRREGARFILSVGNKMGLRYETMATGVVYFHRFYMVHTFQEFPRHVSACCCLFLAGKVEETPKKCRDIMKMAKSLVGESTWAEFGEDPREEVMTLERILLQTIKFDFIVEHPYTYLIKYAKGLKGDKKKLQNMVQMAWTFVNDSLCTTLCLQWQPEIIAIALMYLAGKLNKFEVVDWQGRNSRQQKWWDVYVQGISMELLEDICHQVLDLYSASKIEPAAVSSAPATEPTATVTPSTTSSTPPKLPPPSSTNQPPSKKPKKSDPKVVSPAKTDPSTTQAQSYAYPYSYPGYPPPSYPPPPTTNTTATPPPTSLPPRYPSYAYPSTSQTAPPPPQVTHPPTRPPGPPIASTYQAPPASHFPPPTAGAPPPAHYPSQAPPSTSTHYSAHPPPPYHPPPGNPQSHYQGAASSVAPHQGPPPSHYATPPPHTPNASSYYATPTCTANPPPSYPPGSYSSAPPYSHTASRQYYPPAS